MPDVIAAVLAIGIVTAGILVVIALVVQQRRVARTKRLIRQRDRWQADEVRSEISRLLHNDADKAAISAAIKAWRLVAEEAEVDPGLLRPNDRLRELLPSSVPALANTSLDAIESQLVRLRPNDRATRTSHVVDTLEDFVVACATGATTQGTSGAYTP